MKRPEQLRERLRDGVLAPGCYDALTALMIEEAGFGAAYLSGASLSYAKLGRPDIGLVTASQVADTIGTITDRIGIPLIVDADTGYGNALNVQHTVRMFERMGASAIQIEDQQAPKRCGHLSGKTIISTGEMVGKIKAATDARNDALIVARTDAVAIEGLDAARERAHRYVEAGADLLFIEAPPTLEDMRAIGAEFGNRIPLMANMVEGGTTPMRPFDELTEMGYRLVIFPGAFARSVVFAGREMLAALKADGTTNAFRPRMSDLAGINQLVDAGDLLAQGQRYSPEIQGWGIEGGGKA